jgi:hypothetical protein
MPLHGKHCNAKIQDSISNTKNRKKAESVWTEKVIISDKVSEQSYFL